MFWNRKEKENERKIEQLSAGREECRKRIRRIKKEMDELIQKAAKSDELDRKIYSADYLTLKEQFQAEMQHFTDMSRLIGQLKSAGLTRRRVAALEEIVSVNDQLDLDQMIAREDYMSVRREMMKEEDDLYRNMLAETAAREQVPPEDEEFSRLVARTQIQNCLTEEPEEAERPEKTEAS